MSKTKIAWADSTINPIVGCSKISAGCQNCYAEKMARRLAAMDVGQYTGVVEQKYDYVNDVVKFGGWNGKTAFVPSELEKPYMWKKPRSIFVCSMGDLFHESTPLEWIDMVMRTVCENRRHTFIFLTKRPETMKNQLKLWNDVRLLQRYPNLILGVSVENQQTADERIPILLQIPAAKRFISIEPMLGAVKFLPSWTAGYDFRDGYKIQASRLDGVILGGESGPKARPLDPDWVRSVRDQCSVARVPFMFKQGFGEKFPLDRLTGFPKIDGSIHAGLCWTIGKGLL